MFVFLSATLDTHFIWSFSVSIWFKQENVDWILTVMATKIQKEQKMKNVLKQQKNAAQKRFLHL